MSEHPERLSDPSVSTLLLAEDEVRKAVEEWIADLRTSLVGRAYSVGSPEEKDQAALSIADDIILPVLRRLAVIR